MNRRFLPSRAIPIKTAESIHTKLATPNSGVWKWPRTFYESYFPRLIKMGYLTEQDMENAFSDLESLERLPYATLWAPLMIEVVAEK